MKFIFTCGGTAGHINPAIGIAGRLCELLPETEILFVGAEGMMETELIPKEGFDIRTIRISNLSRSFSLQGIKHNLGTIHHVVSGIREARKIIQDFGPNAVIGTGGYVCYPVLKAARSLGIPTLVHESNAVPGLTTKLLSHDVDCVMLGFEHAKENYAKGVNTVFTGTPVRRGFDALSREEARSRLGIPDNQPMLLSVWGSLGSDYMNDIMAEFVPIAMEENRFNMIHSAGKRGYDKLVSSILAHCSSEELKNKGIEIRDYIFDMPIIMAAADLIICRSGASTLAELAAMGKPAMLIPSPNVTNNHQEKNARQLEKAGAAMVLLEGEFDAKERFREVSELIMDSTRLAMMSEKMRSCCVSDATGKIADLILTYATV